MKTYLTRERLDSGGYTSEGYYFGTGIPLYYAQSECLTVDEYIRAYDREDAKERLKAKYPSITFFR